MEFIPSKYFISMSVTKLFRYHHERQASTANDTDRKGVSREIEETDFSIADI